MDQVMALVTNAPSGGAISRSVTITGETGDILLKPLYTGICGTDRGIIAGKLPFAYNPVGYDFLVLGHESICSVVESDVSGFKAGDLVVPMVRRPGKCLNCAAGRQDNCSDGDKHEAGITGKHGFMREQFRESSRYVVRVGDSSLSRTGVLTEPTKNVMKLFEVFSVISGRSIYPTPDYSFQGKHAWIIGTGSEGFLFSFMAREQGFDTFMTNRHSVDEGRLGIMDQFGINFVDYSRDFDTAVKDIDLLIDTSGDPTTILRFTQRVRQNGIVFLFGTNGRAPDGAMSGVMVDHLVEKNITIAGSVDGAKRHYEQAVSYISKWTHEHPRAMSALITNEEPASSADPFKRGNSNGIKTIISWK